MQVNTQTRLQRVCRRGIEPGLDSNTQDGLSPSCRRKTGASPSIVILCQSCGEALSVKRKCKRCKLVFYCNEVCQKKDWSKHRKYCSAHESLNMTEIDCDFDRKIESFMYRMGMVADANNETKDSVFLYTSISDKLAKVPDHFFLQRYSHLSRLLTERDRNDKIIVAYEFYIEGEPYLKLAILKARGLE